MAEIYGINVRLGVQLEVIVTIVSKLVYNLFTGLTTYISQGYNPFTKYHGHPSKSTYSIHSAHLGMGLVYVVLENVILMLLQYLPMGDIISCEQ